ncbi:MAG: tRNA lysidine(34) synthetase TilS [Bryobacter sp.]|nr:tRNA lysidine(34) synthetase TilS [Bryobacter sp.]
MIEEGARPDNRSAVARHLEEFSNRYRSLKEAPVWGLAASGGADSTALVLATAELGVRAVLLHVNYGLRGMESDADEGFVRQLAAQHQFDVRVLRVTPANKSEAALREIRYAWFRECGFPAILTGHTLDDQAETVLHRILRGTGVEGLRGIRPFLEDGFYRPFLGLRREGLRAYLRERAQPWREDSSNESLDYRRNFIRQDLLPKISSTLNPEAALALARLAQIADEEEQWLGAMVADLAPHFARREAGAWIVNAEDLAQTPPALQRRLLRHVCKLLDPAGEISFDHIEQARGLCLQIEGSGRLQLPGLDLLRSFGEVRLAALSAAGAEERRNWRFPLEIGEVLHLPDGAGELRATVEEISQYNENGEDLDWKRLSSGLPPNQGLEVRNWRPGDEICRVGRENPEKLKELFQKFRIPLWQRRNWPIVVLVDVPVWSRQFGASANFAAGRECLQRLRIHWAPREDPGGQLASPEV